MSSMNVIVSDNQKYPILLGQSMPNQLVELKTTLHVEEKKMCFFTCRPKGRYNLKIVNLKTGILQLDSKRPLVTVACKGQQGVDIPLELTDYKTDIQLVLHPDAVVDLKGNVADMSNQDLQISLSFELELTKEGEQQGKRSDTIQLPVQLVLPQPVLKYEICWDKKSLQYNPDVTDKQRVGELRLFHGLNLKCASDLSTIFFWNVKCEDVEYPDFLTLDMDHIEESNKASVKGDITVNGGSTSALVSNVMPVPGNQGQIRLRYSFSGIRVMNPVNQISVPIMMDMSKVINPRGEQKFLVTINGDYKCNWLSERIKQKIPALNENEFVLKKNVQMQDLQVLINDARTNKYEELNSGSVFEWNSIPLSRMLATEFRCTVQLKNTATVIDPAFPEACLRVLNLKQSNLNIEDKRIRMRNRELKVRDYFAWKDLSDQPLDGRSVSLYPLQKDNNTYCFILKVCSRDIVDIKRAVDGRFCTSASLEFEFDYVFDSTGNTPVDQLKDLKHYKGIVVWEMEQIANPEWLSVDYGTSAIVASFDKSFDPERNSLIDLKANKTELMRRTYTKDTNRQKDNTSEEAPFIPSVISLNSVNNKGSYNKERKDEEFRDYPLWLSPTTNMMDIMLPCLKMLVGYKTLPNILTDNEQNKFNYEGENGESLKLLDEEGQVQEQGLGLVNVILEEVYKQLFRHYICQKSKDPLRPNPVNSEALHKLVLSVPNTFTPRHHALLKDTAKRFFPNLHPKYLQVVSESDAVACYYLSNRDQFFTSAKASLNDARKVELDRRERVLVYDMGAGTLDLTYFEKEMVDEVMVINMKGKLGVNKAGNYLDYLLGEILCDFLREAGASEQSVKSFANCLETSKMKRIINMTSKKECEALKTFVKENIKPKLNSDDEVIPSYKSETGNYEFKTKDGKQLLMKDIRQTAKYKTYIQSCTGDVLDNLKYLLSGKILLIDVLVFSGRSTTLYDVRKAVADYILSQPVEDDKQMDIFCADLVSKTMLPLREISQSKQFVLNASLLKTVVTHGSLIYADWINRRDHFKFKGCKVFADFGVLMLHTQKGWEWYPLITNQSTEEPLSGNVFGPRRLFYGEMQYNMSAAKEIYFVQSYSRQPAIDWKNGQKDMISVITHIDVPDGTTGNQTISMSLDVYNTITCKVGEFGEIKLEPHDDFDNESLRKSLWPVAF